MEEARVVNRIETNLSQEKIDFINAAYAEEVDYWKMAALLSKNEEERKQLINLAPSRVFLVRKDAGKCRVENIYEMLFYLKRIIHLIMKSKLVLMKSRGMIVFHSKKCQICYKSRKYEFKE